MKRFGGCILCECGQSSVGFNDMNKVAVCAAICLALTVAAFAADANKDNKAARRVDVQEFASLIGNTNAVLLDVRTAEEYKEGHIKDARNVDIHSADFAAKIAELDKSRTYLVYCAAGGRSAQACKKMSQMGFANLVDLASGFSGWKAAKKPFEK
jgi:rhodanese-related sulfurtransferase